MRRRSWHILLFAGALVSALAMTMCGPGDDTATSGSPCPQGICAGASSGAGGTGSTGTMTSSVSTTGAGMCVESWLCTPWDTGGNGDAATRTCTDVNTCGTTDNKPSETATLPALDVGYFKCNVEPILDRKCSMMGCHGAEIGRALRVYSRGRLRNTGENLTDPALCAGSAGSTGCIGSISCPCTAKHTDIEWQKNYDSARGFMLDAQGAPIPAGMEDTSDFIAQAVIGGKAHSGFHLYAMGDPDYVILHSWLTSAGKSTPCDPTPN